MSNQHKASGRKAAETMMSRYGADYYKSIGALGGKAGTTGGFYVNRELARVVGSVGGKNGKPYTKKPRPVKV